MPAHLWGDGGQATACNQAKGRTVPNEIGKQARAMKSDGEDEDGEYGTFTCRIARARLAAHIGRAYTNGGNRRPA